MLALETTRVLEILVLPPASALVLLLLALLVWRRRKLSFALAACGTVLLYGAAIPAVSDPLLESLQQRHPVLDPAALEGGGVIVVLGGGRDLDAPEYGARDVPSPATLQRLRYGAHLHRRSGLPLLLSGGGTSARSAEATFMERVARQDLGAQEVWIEDRSRTTAENARFTAALLAERGVDRVILVTHASHMPRAVGVFRNTGLEVVPAPTAFHRPDDLDRGWYALLPRDDALERTNEALHEYLGMAWYALMGE